MTSTQIKILAVLGALVGILAIFTAVVFALDSDGDEPKTVAALPTATSGPATVPPTAVTAVRGTPSPIAPGGSPTPTRSAGSTAAPSPSPARAGVVVRAPVAVNIRRGPGTEFPIIVTLGVGDELPATGRNLDGSWLFVTLADGTGWVALDIVEVVNGAAASLPAVPAPTPPPAPPRTPSPAPGAAPAGSPGAMPPATSAPAAPAATANPGVGPVRTAPPPPPSGPATRIPTVPPP